MRLLGDNVWIALKCCEQICELFHLDSCLVFTGAQIEIFPADHTQTRAFRPAQWLDRVIRDHVLAHNRSDIDVSVIRHEQSRFGKILRFVGEHVVKLDIQLQIKRFKAAYTF